MLLFHDTLRTGWYERYRNEKSINVPGPHAFAPQPTDCEKTNFVTSCMTLNNIFLLCIALVCLPTAAAKAQNRKPVVATRISEAPKIDGLLNDDCWKSGVPYTDFVEAVPAFGAPAKNRTEVTVVYDNDAMYVAAKCFMTPDSIWLQLTERDDIFSSTDAIAFAFDTYHDGQNALGFGVTPRNVQGDFKLILNSDDDFSWDAVWESKVYIAPDGWYAEMKIPYSALRFPKVAVQDWTIDFYRIVRSTRYEYHSAGINPEENGIVSQFQPLTGVSDIEPPLRLSLSPYATVYANFFRDKLNNISSSDLDFKGGMDLKWGINESFTLDATLIPDFGQVQSDNIIYNLSALEVQYDENRSFFTEGTELFTKAELFYSRRIGFVSDYYSTHNDTTVTVDNPPINTRLLNATKISGRNRHGLGIGVFNAITGNTYATATGSDGETKEVLYDPLTNFNVLVLDQGLKNNSYLTFTNTNVLRDAKGRNANVANVMSFIADKKQHYAGFGYLAVSTLMNKSTANDDIDFSNGYLYRLSFKKISGNFTYDLSHIAISKNYDPNDLGYLTIRNQNTEEAILRYDIYKPFGKFLELHSENTLAYGYRNSDGAYTGATFDGSTFMLTGKYLGFFAYYFAAPFGEHDYYEPRAEDRYYAMPAIYELGAGISTDYRKHIALDIEGGPAIWNEPGRIKYRWQVTPRIRIGDKVLLVPQNETHLYYNDVGFVDTDDTGNIIFGRRDIKEYDTNLSGNYIFNSNMSVGLKLRYYSQKGIYDQYYTLEQDGSLGTTGHDESNDYNFNAWNIDLNFTWWFLPGSEINLVWKNSIIGFDDQATLNFIKNLDHTFDFPRNNNISVRIKYYLDYQDVKRGVK